MDLSKAETTVESLLADPSAVSKAVVTVEHVKDILSSIQAIIALFHKAK